MLFSVQKFVFARFHLQAMLDKRDEQLLEDHMGFRGQFEEHRRFQLEFLKAQGLQPSNRLLEIGCGPLTAGLPLIGYLNEGNYVGVDVRSSVLDLSWKEVGRMGLSGKNPRLICSPSFGEDDLQHEQFDFVLSFSVLYHLNDDILEQFFSTIKKRLRPAGVCFSNVNTAHEDGQWLQFPFLKRSLGDYVNLAGRFGLQTKPMGTLQQLGFRLPSAERLNEMLAFRLAR